MIEQIEKSEKLNVYIHRDSGGDINRVTIIGKFGNVQYWYPMGRKHIESIDVTTCEKCYRQLGMDDASINVKFIEEE
jgi:hypothetical protein